MKDDDPDLGPYRKMYEEYPGQEEKPTGPEHRFNTAIKLLAGGAAISTYFGVTAILPGQGVSHTALTLFLPVLTGGLTYLGHKATFLLGAKQAAAGDMVATALCVGWFTLNTVVVGTIGFAGVSRDLVESAVARKPAQEIVAVSRSIGEQAGVAKGVVPLMRKAGAEFQGYATCELQGCYSGRPGRGPEVATLTSLAQKFGHVVGLFAQADAPQKARAKRLENLASTYEAALTKGGATGANRAVLVRLYSEAQSLATQAAAGLPMTAVLGLARDLRGLAPSFSQGVRVDVGGRMRAVADELEQAIPAKRQFVLAPFPEPSGISVGWRRLDLTWALMVFIYGLEALAFVLWVLLVRDFVRGRRAAERASRKSVRPSDHDDNVIGGPGRRS